MAHLASLQIIREADYPQAIITLEAQLESWRVAGYFSGHGGGQIHYEYFLRENSRGCVVIVHGMSEFTRKYYEPAWYFLEQGYSVFLYDQRGHGFSHREVDPPELIHLESFDALVEDLEAYRSQIVLPRAQQQPLYLYAHSMGGAVALLHLARYPQAFQRAVLTSPMIAPTTSNLPEWVFRWSTGLGCRLGRGKQRFVFSRDFDPDRPYSPRPAESKNRAVHCLRHRCRHREYQSTPLTVGCVYRSLGIKRELLSKAVTRGISTPILMLCAGKDTTVKLRPQAVFAKKCPQCTRTVLPDTSHALLCSETQTLQAVMGQILSFFAEEGCTEHYTP